MSLTAVMVLLVAGVLLPPSYIPKTESLSVPQHLAEDAAMVAIPEETAAVQAAEEMATEETTTMPVAEEAE
eukprot:5411699-Amphidinium_carterae.1